MNELLTTFGINWKLLLAQGFNFGILLVALWWFLYRPVLDMLSKRQSVIEKGVHDARAAEEQLKKAGEEAGTVVSKASQDAEEIIAVARTRANEKGVEIRAEQTGPVFSVDPRSGRLHMRYSARKRNIEWKQDEITAQAAAMITECLSDDSLMRRHALTAGQGIICNNVLHNRARFEDSDNQKRLMYRARYYDRVCDNQMKNALESFRTIPSIHSIHGDKK